MLASYPGPSQREPGNEATVHVHVQYVAIPVGMLFARVHVFQIHGVYAYMCMYVL